MSKSQGNLRPPNLLCEPKADYRLPRGSCVPPPCAGPAAVRKSIREKGRTHGAAHSAGLTSSHPKKRKLLPPCKVTDGDQTCGNHFTIYPNTNDYVECLKLIKTVLPYTLFYQRVCNH